MSSRDKMIAYSAGLLLFRRKTRGLEVFLIHPGGPYWANKDVGAWSIPKGLVGPEEDRLAAAKREFKEETGFEVDGAFLELGMFRQPTGKRLFVWAVEGDCEPARLVSNEFTMVWPPNSTAIRSFPEADRGEWFGLKEAGKRILKGQRPILEKFTELIT
jgi:predicted NUDIX family NTP pyrophosphohydrolase